MIDKAEEVGPDVAHACGAGTRLCTLVAHAFSVPCRHSCRHGPVLLPPWVSTAQRAGLRTNNME